MDELQENEFTGKTVEEATAEGLRVLGITEEQAEITVLEEGKKKLFGSVKARVKVVKKVTDSERALTFIEGLLDLLKIPCTSEVISDGEKIEIEITTTNAAAVIGKRGEVLDSIQCMAGAVANIGREDYRRVVVDCENYRSAREEKIKRIALGKAKKAAETCRRVALDPMSPYERRVVHSVLADSEEVKTVSEGKEPMRRVVIIPNNEKPFEKRPYKKPYDKPYGAHRPAQQGGRQFNRDKRYAERAKEEGETSEEVKKEDGYKKDGYRRNYRDGYNKEGYNRDRGYNREDKESYNREGKEYSREGKEGYNKEGYGRDNYNREGREYNRDRRYGDRRNNRGNSGSRPARGKKEIYLGTYLGNSGAGKEQPADDKTDKKEEE